ncbi:AsmA-like C-terminal region-containing protein [Roseibium salinum]|uniref:AsmA family protein n=1 Tax=Roseibium salinum TaxID=1604349 RepID=UPI003616BA5C
MRAFIVFLAVTAAVVLVIAVARPRVSTQHVEARVAEYVAHASGGKSRITGESALRLLPLPVVTVKSVEIEGIGEARQAARIDIPSMEVSFQFLPLLMSGELVVDGIKLDQPVVQLVRTPGADRGDIKSGLNSILQAVLAADSAAKKAKVIDVQDGRIELEDGNGGRREEIAMPRMHLARADRQDALHLAGKVEWHGFQIGIDADLDTRDGTRPGLCCEGDVTVEIAPAETEPGSFEVPVLWDSGTQTDPDAPRDEPYSLSELLTQATAAAPLRLSGAFKAGTQHVRLEDVALELGDIAAAGSLGVDLAGEVPSISAEMAFQELDLGRHLHAFLPTSLDEVLAWPVRADVFANADLDLSAVVAEAALGDIIFAGPSVRLVGNRRGITLTLERTEVASGRIQGLVTVQPAGQEALVQLSGSLADVSLADIGEALRHGAGRIPVGQDRPPEGYVTGSIDLSGKGSTLKAVTRSLRGWGASVVRDGSLAGADIVATLERVADNSTLVDEGKPLIPVAGRTYFSALVASAAVADGVVRAPHIHFRGENFKIDFSADVDLAQGEIEAAGSASLFAASSGQDWETLIELPFGIGGTMREPMFARHTRDRRHAGDTLPCNRSRRRRRGHFPRSKCGSL